MLKNAETYQFYVQDIIKFGYDNFRDDRRLKEMFNCSICFNANEPIWYHVERRVNYRFALAEALTLVDNIPNHDLMIRENPGIQKFIVDGKYQGDYGHNIHKQIGNVVDILIKDRRSRRANLIVNNHLVNDDMFDIFCTNSFTFYFGAQNKLNLSVCMRSSDASVGLIYDIFNFCMILRYVRDIIFEKTKIFYDLGSIGFLIVNGHVYESNFSDDFDNNTNKRINPDFIADYRSTMKTSDFLRKWLNEKSIVI